MNGGYSSIRFAVFSVGEPLRRLLQGKIERIGGEDAHLSIEQDADRAPVRIKLRPNRQGTAIGNLLDRFRFKYVVDFLDVYVTFGGREHHWPAFNVADSAICIGIGLLFLDMRRKPEENAAAAVT